MRVAASKPKGVQTRERIVRSAAALFNRRGYAATPISEVLHAAGIEKGGLYRHFASKDVLAAAAFDYAAEKVAAHHRKVWNRAPTARAKLHAVIDGFRLLEAAPPLGGGCPLFNAAVEVDDGDAPLRERVDRAISGFHGAVAAIVRGGIASGEFAGEVDAELVASVFVATLEGALVLARVQRDARHLARVGAHLDDYVASLPSARRARRTRGA